MKNLLWEKAYELLAHNTGFVMATIVRHEGSTPRASGTKMIITGDGSITGTIGGGLLEARVMEKAVRTINEQGDSTFMPFDLTCEDIESMDMICGGQADIFLDHVLPTQENIRVFDRWKRVSENKGNGFFITAVVGAHNRIEQVVHGVMDRDGVLEGDLFLPAGDMEDIVRETRKAPVLKYIKLDSARVIIEAAVKPKTAFLFGAGHVAQPTAHLSRLTGFYVTVIDDRKAFANTENFPDAHEIRVIDTFENAFEGLDVEEDSFIVIFTRGHLHDRTVLSGALKTQAGYIGMIGSRKKRDTIYKALLKSGYGQKDIDRVHSPIGLDIGAASPEEIAVSIVGEMIQERSRMSK
jgi:xanthine dehydrogenase accessory factor